MRTELRELLAPHGVYMLQIDREEILHGEPATGINLQFRGGDGIAQKAEFKFAKGNAMTIEQMTEVIVSYITNPSGDENT